jgi:broad specificity phosphatase PhoE
MLLAVVRHGQTDYNLKKVIQGQIDIPLNHYGKAQAHQLSKLFIKNMDTFDSIISSCILRTVIIVRV